MARVVRPTRRPARPLRRRPQTRVRQTRRPLRRPATATRATSAAQRRLRRFRQGSVLVVSITALLLLVWGIPESLGQDTDAAELPEPPSDPGEAVEQATTTLWDLLLGFYGMLPKIGIAILCLVLAAVVTRVVGAALRRLLRDWEHANALSAMSAVVVWLVALGAALSVIAGDASALIGSVGLAGLALSWALQAPIESFTGWLLNSFRGYYRVGDRIAVGDVFGDVYTIDVLTTTVWEAGGPDKPVQGAQPTGALVTFPNSEVLRANIVNYTRAFPYVWDEVTVSIADDSDLPFARDLALRVATTVVGEAMTAPAAHYAQLLRRQRLDWDVATEPQVYLSAADFWTNLTVRYLVPARERRKWSSALYIALVAALNEHPERVGPAYVREHALRLDELAHRPSPG